MDPAIEKIYSSPRLRSQDVQQERTIFIIHGFHTPIFRFYRDVLEQWALERARAMNAPVAVYLLRFDASGVPSQGKVILERAVWKLRRFLLKKAFQYLADDDTQDREPQDDYSTQDDHSIASASPLSRNRRISFLAHALGCWIVKDVLAHPKMDSFRYAYAIIDMKFLDASVDRELEADDQYRNYLGRNWATFAFGSPKHHKGAAFNQLVSYLREIDENFETFANTHITEAELHVVADDPRPPTIYRDPDYPIWMSQGHQDQVVFHGIEPTGGERLSLSRLLVGAQPSARQAPMIGKFPGSLDATEHFPPQLYQTGISQPGSSLRPPSIPSAPIDAINSSYVPLRTHIRTHLKNKGHMTPELGNPYHRKEDDEWPDEIVSFPDRVFIPMSTGHILSTCRLANVFLQKGELHNAGVLFEKVLAHTSSQDRSGTDMVWIRMQVAAVKIYRGYYQAGEEDLDDIEKGLKMSKKKSKIADEEFRHLMYQCERWMATCRLYAGRWRDAANQMKTLLKNDPMGYHVRLHRDQGLAYAYLGRYWMARSCLNWAKKRAETAVSAVPSLKGGPQNDGSETGQSPARDKAERDRQTKENSLKAAEARIGMLAGDYPAALRHSSEALNYMKTMVGSRHFRTLATATLKAWALAYDAKYNEAENLCSTTWKATKAALGRNHPQTLEAIGCLIYIYRSQGRFAEAVGTGISATSSTSHGHENIRDHPEHIHVEFQLAQSLLANGDYAESRAIFAKLVPQAEIVMGADHPETLRYKAEQAQVLLNLGSITEARDLASHVALRQFRIYNQISAPTARIAEPSESVLRSKYPSSSNPWTRLDEPLHNTSRSVSSPKNLHPFLLATLQLSAKIEIRQFQLGGSYEDKDRPNGNLQTAHRILQSLHGYHIKREEQQTATDKNNNRLPSASTAHDIATLLKDQPPPHPQPQQEASQEEPDPPLASAVKLYSYTYNTLRQTLDENHLSTLLAQRDLMIAQTLHSSPDPQTNLPYLKQVKSVSDCLYRKLESRLGVLHPEALTMRLWCFTIDLLLASSPFIPSRSPDAPCDNPASSGKGIESSRSRSSSSSSSIDHQWEEINNNLRVPCVVEQRLVESLAMRRQLAGLLTGTGRTEQAVKVVEGALGDITGHVAILDSLERDRAKRKEEGLEVGNEEGFGEEGLRKTLEGLRTSFEGIRGDCYNSSTGTAQD